MNSIIPFSISVPFQKFFSVLLLAIAIIMVAPKAQAEFDPVNDDTDIFLANPNLPANRPNVLIILDNTANWNRSVGGQAINVNELAALSSVVQNLGDEFNIGLMLFPQSTDAEDGAYLRFGIRQMTSTNRTALANLVGGLTSGGGSDQGNNNTVSGAMLEAYRYYAGKAEKASSGADKTDFNGNTTTNALTPFEAGLSDFPLPNNSNGSLYDSPIEDICQDSFIIYISNGPSNENSSQLSVSETELASLGFDTSSTISLSPSGQQGNWMDEWAYYMANADMNGAADGSPHVYTYVVEVDPQTTGQNDDMTALLQSVALKGEGGYFAVSSANAGAGITNALNSIFNEIQAVNSVFAATTLPVSVNVRGTNLNQVYIGVFRPDDTKAPRWFGNLKMYQLGFNDATSTLFLADSTGAVAENTTTGFIDPGAVSFHTTSSGFWGFRDTDENGTGGASDSPDGDLVEKGGIAQGIRTDFATVALQDSDRNLYTCTTGTVSCTTNSSLSATKFADPAINDGMTSAGFGLGTTAVSSLTGFLNVPITELTDNKTLTDLVAPGAGAVAINSLSSVPIEERTVTGVSTSAAKPIISITNTISQEGIDDLNRGTGGSKNIATLVDNNGNFTGITQIHVAGVGAAEYNGTFSITVVNATTVTYNTGVSNPTPNPNITGATYSITGSTVTVNVANHGFLDTDDVTINGVTPAHFNGLRDITSVTPPDIFRYSTGANSQLAPVTSFAGATVSGPSTIATATIDNAGGAYTAGNTIIISGASVAGYNGIHSLATVSGATNPATITFNVGSALAVPTGTIKISKGYTVTGTLTAGHGLVDGNPHTISGVTPSAYNGTFSPTIGATSFTYTTTNTITATPATVTGTITPATNFGSTAIATLVGHGLATGDKIVVSGGSNPEYTNGGAIGATACPGPDAGTSTNRAEFTVTKIDDNTFSYVLGNSFAGLVIPKAPCAVVGANKPSFRLNNTNGTAIATSVAHGLATGNSIVISDAVDGETAITDSATYNGTHTITVTSPDTFTYDLGITKTNLQGAATGMTGNIKTTTAKARVVNHGFVTGDSVAISGATPAAFNKAAASITVTDTDNFTYTIATAEGDATGSIVASSGAGSAGELSQLIAWVRGADNNEDENNDGSNTDVRASVHGDVLHSRPAVVNYNRFGNDDDVYIFYGANDGIFRAVKGGFNQADTVSMTEPEPFEEAWGFIPEEFFSSFARLRNNEPIITSNNKKPYFADGSIGVYTKDVNDDGKLDHADGDKVWLYISMHRGGRLLYALDVSNPLDPKLLWRKSNGSAGWGELGQTWSLPNVQEIAIDTDGAGAADDNDKEVVLVFGAGYDALVEDLDPLGITAFNEDDDGDGSLEVEVGAASYERGQGRGIFVVDALTGDILWQAGPAVANPGASHTFLTVSGMDYAIPSDVVVISDQNSTNANRAYVGDTGGNFWRVDMSDPSVTNWTVTKIADIADHVTVKPGVDDDGVPFTNFPGLRKFLFPPDVVYSEDGYDAILVGSGDREHPFDDSIVNRFYMFKDTNIGTSVAGGFTSYTESDLFDATSNCIQAASGCSGSGDEIDSSTAATALTTKKGWYITLATGEKVVGNAVTLNNTTFFNTNVPSSVVGATGSCESDLGEARQYQVRFDDASAIADQNIDGYTNASDRYNVHAGGGYLPSPVPVVVEINGEIHEGVISGVNVSQPPGSVLNTRLRKFWYKEME
jgi:Tfp pilus tip-associated adhesin PilY1